MTPLPGTNMVRVVFMGAVAETVIALPGVAEVPDGHAVVFVKQALNTQVVDPLVDVSVKLMELAGRAGPAFTMY